MRTAAARVALPVLAILVIAALLGATNSDRVGLSAERLRRIDAMIEQRIATGDLTGAVTVIARRGQVAHVSVHGVMDLDNRKPMATDTMSRNVYFRGSGGLVSTAESYVRFGIMLANQGELDGVRLLSRKSVEMLRAVHVPDTLPGRPAGEGYGLSVRVVTDHAARGTLLSDGSYGWSGGQGTHFFVDPEEQLVGILMVQTPNDEVRRDFENLAAQAIAD